IATFHDAWYYFAREYGLKVAATFKPFPGQQPSPAWLAGFIETVRRENIQWIFSEPQFSPDAISQVAKDLGVRVSVLDPEGGAGDYNGETGYIAMMKWNAAVLLETLGQQ
ncbi:MAG TPA: metal ABC transporter substrate-binding protein, partial [Sedimentisphaerales bacterium]|nr:metal ABC transporter substrate-binding protein [Sedimentisphaerales bacterium]